MPTVTGEMEEALEYMNCMEDAIVDELSALSSKRCLGGTMTDGAFIAERNQ
jgi:hypothetical protein